MLQYVTQFSASVDGAKPSVFGGLGLGETNVLFDSPVRGRKVKLTDFGWVEHVTMRVDALLCSAEAGTTVVPFALVALRGAQARHDRACVRAQRAWLRRQRRCGRRGAHGPSVHVRVQHQVRAAPRVPRRLPWVVRTPSPRTMCAHSPLPLLQPTRLLGILACEH